ncbi:ENR1 protein, partial [Chordeiles acutipennis]|nr:ENR1 protein [Chordeiles acutipennis]
YNKIFWCNGTTANPYKDLPEIAKHWNNIAETQKGFWRAPEGLFWICGKRAYSELHGNWKSSCTLGIIQPGFFLLSGSEGDNLGVPL